MRVWLLRPPPNRQIRIPRLISHLRSGPHTDLTDLTVSLCGRKISQMLYVGLLQCLTQNQRDSTKIKFVLIHGFSHQPRISTIFVGVLICECVRGLLVKMLR